MSSCQISIPATQINIPVRKVFDKYYKQYLGKYENVYCGIIDPIQYYARLYNMLRDNNSKHCLGKIAFQTDLNGFIYIVSDKYKFSRYCNEHDIDMERWFFSTVNNTYGLLTNYFIECVNPTGLLLEDSIFKYIKDNIQLIQLDSVDIIVSASNKKLIRINDKYIYSYLINENI